jgi:hypothetical protein
MLFKNGVDLQAEITRFIDKSSAIFIFSPYIKLDTLKALINTNDKVVAVFVRWEAKDLILGSSDLEIYSFLKSKGIALFRNTRLHLKAYIDNYENCFLTTANISSRALNLPAYSNYNYEIGTVVENLKIEDRLYFQLIESDSTLITDDIYKQFFEQLKEKKKDFPHEIDFEIKIENPDKDFLISSLPLTQNIDLFFKIYAGEKIPTEEELNCFLHDLALYKIPFGLSKEECKIRLAYSFFNHKFIKAFLDNLISNIEIYFGRAKDWVHENCRNVPLPRKWEITENIQILYSWIVELGNGKYGKDRPNYSERLFICKQ